jgi:probable phosphoglycerate mutase
MGEPRNGGSKRPEPKRGYYLLNTDGGMESSGRRRPGEAPGNAAIGAVLKTPRMAVVAEISMPIGPATHNVGEYQALIQGLKLAREHGIARIRVYLDSELVVDHMNGVSKVRQRHLKPLYASARDLVGEFASIRICWVPREMNAEADRLVNKALAPLASM